MKKLIALLIASVLLLGCFSFAAAESGASEHAVPVEIRSLTRGEKASMEIANAGDADLMMITFRFRGWDDEGKIVNIFEAAEAGKDLAGEETIILLDVTCIPFLQPGQSQVVSLSEGYEAVKAARLEAAVQQVTLADGSTVRIPESQLVWFSSEGGYAGSGTGSFRYDYPESSVFSKSYTFSLGVTVVRVYPEFLAYFDVTHPGYGIAAVRHGLFSNAGVQEDDLIWAVNGISLADDPYALEKAKAAIVDGQAMTLSILRNGEEITITLPPEVMLTPP